jgi:predicted O-methyltransferase YrrM
MSQPQPQSPNEQWITVDRYLVDTLVGSDAALEAALADSTAAGLPAINVAPNQGKLLQLLARIQNARRILEVGTLGGYSTIWLARALPEDGRLVTLEVNPTHAEVARKNLVRAGVAAKVEIIVGNALETLPQLGRGGHAPFDFVFIDGDKVNLAPYFSAALTLSRPGTVIVVDNVVRRGAVADANSADANVQGVRRLNDLIAREPRVTATAIQTVGSKGHDGFTLALVTG